MKQKKYLRQSNYSSYTVINSTDNIDSCQILQVMYLYKMTYNNNNSNNNYNNNKSLINLFYNL